MQNTVFFFGVLRSNRHFLLKKPFLLKLASKTVCLSRAISLKATPIFHGRMMDGSPGPSTPCAAAAAKASPMVPPLTGVKRKRQEKEEKNTFKELQTLFDDPDRKDYEFVCTQLEPKSGPQGKHVKKVAEMIRKGYLDKLDALREVANDESQPATLPEEMIQYKQLTKPLLIKMIMAWEPLLPRPGASPENPGRNPLWDIPRDTLFKWALYALNVKPVHQLPHLEELRREKNFLVYTTARYNELFSRLQCLRGDTELTKDSVPGYFSTDIEAQKITLNNPSQGNKPLDFVYNFRTYDDWIIANPFSVDAVLQSKKAGEMTHLRTKLKATLNITLPDPTDNWDVMSAYRVLLATYSSGLGS